MTFTMTWLAEDPLPIWLAGALAFTMAMIVYLQLRTTWALALAASVLVLIAALTLAERLVVTPREAVNQALIDTLAAVEADDLQETLSCIAASAIKVRADAQAIMPKVEIRRARITDTPKITLDGESRASARFRVFVDASESTSGMKGGFFDDVEVQFVKEGDRWLVSSYQPTEEWQSRLKNRSAKKSGMKKFNTSLTP